MQPKDIGALRFLADDIVKTDGDRDHMNQSRLSVKQTLLVAKALRLCADELEQFISVP